MRFLALLKKELRECMPWLLLAMIILLLFGTPTLHISAREQRMYGGDWNQNPGTRVSYWELTDHSPLSSVGPLMLFTCIGLGLALAGRQFWMPHFVKTWAFTIHRSVRRADVLWAKLGAGAISFLIINIFKSLKLL